jgi:V-type H+-transporting ATPase subunit G
VQKLKDAKTEANKEIEALKAKKQAEYAQSEKDYSGSIDSSISLLEKETELKLKAMNEIISQKKGAVIEKLLANVVNVEPKIHINAKTLV